MVSWLTCSTLSGWLRNARICGILISRQTHLPDAMADNSSLYTVNVDCVKFEYVVLAKYHHMLIFEFDLLTKQHILILCKKLL